MSEQDASDASDGNGADAAESDEQRDGEATVDGADTDESHVSDVDTDLDDVDVATDFDDVEVESELDEGSVDVDLDDVEAAFDEVPEELVERVEEADPESIAHELAALRTRVGGLEDQLEAREEELDDVTSKLKRKQADFQNYKKRMEKRREQEKERATEDLVERLLDVRDNLVRALEQESADVEDLREGIESTLRTFDRELEEENVTVVAPDPGDDVDPQRHEVLMRVESDRPEDTIADVHRQGYVMADKVVRPAQVTVSDGPAGSGE